jgi:hypothetical protein
MITNLKFQSKVQWLQRLLLLALLTWAIGTTAALMHMRPEIVLIGIDQYGTRLIKDEHDRLLRIEKENFMKKYLTFMFNYKSETFEPRISSAGDMMSEALWSQKKADFQRIASNMKGVEIEQITTIDELRETTEDTFEADLSIKVKTKLHETVTKIRVELKLRETPRSATKPFPYEVTSHVENTLS